MSIKISRGGLTDVEMVRERRSSLALGACIGMFVLLFSTAAADIERSKDLPKVLRYKDFTLTALGVPTVEKNNAILNKIPLEVETEEFASSDRRDKRDTVKGPALSELVNDKSEDDAKVIDKEFEEQGTRPRNEVDGSSTSDSTSGSSRFEETPRETSGKSSSTKTISDEFNRLSRTNDLIVVTTKPALEVDQKTNETIPDTIHHEPNKTNEPTLFKQEREIDAQAKFEESDIPASKLETNKLEALSTARLSAEKLQEDPSPTKNAEVPDLRETDENRGSDEPISLINDTYVNYSQHQKTSTEKNLGTSSGEQSRAIESATNFISEDRAITQKPRDPKKDVEVVENVSKTVAQRIEDGRSQNVTTIKTKLIDEPVHTFGQTQPSIEDSTKTSDVHELIDEKNQQKLVELTTEKPSDEETVEPPSHVPKGRTIAFSGMNEFSNQETKPEPTAKIDVPFPRKNASAEKIAEQKPYPYLKPSGKEEVRNDSNQADATTEEASALENTIGRGQSDAKFIVTEASDVLENSIQQLKPTYYEKAGNESSTTSTTPLRPSIPATTVSPAALAGAQPTNQSAADGSIDPRTTTKTEGKSAATGNDVPRWGEGREAITDKGNFDITGNGITEVSVKPESADKRTYGPFDPTLATIKPQGISSNLDVQTNAESALLIRSTLNATELVTEYPLVKLHSSEANFTVPTVSELATENVTMSPTVIDKIFTKDVTDSSGTLDSNGTNEIPSGATGPPSFDEIPSTTGIEYEFVGLTEATTFFLGQNVTENTPDAHEPTNDVTTVPTIQDLFDNGSSNETSTVRSLTVTDNSLSNDTESTGSDEKSSGVSVTDQTTIPMSTINPTTQFRDDPITQANVVDEETGQTSTREDESQKTSGKTNFWTTVSDDDAAVTATTEDSTLSPGSKDSLYTLNVTETPAESTVAASVGTTGATRADSPSPFVPTSPRPGSPFSSTASTPAASGIPAETTDDTKTSPASEEITSLVRIVMEGTWNEICPKMEELKSALAKILADGTKRSVSNEQIMFHRQPPCPEVSSPSPTSDMPLTSILVYVVDENGRFDSAMTTSLPSLYQESKETVQFPFKIHSFLLVQETIPDSGNAIAVVVVSVVAFICLVLLAGLLFIMKKRQTRFNYGERCRPVSLDAYSVDSVSAYNSVRRKGVARSSKRSYGNPTFEDSSAIPSHPLNFAGLSSFCNDVNAINEEFSSIPQVSAKIDELPPGAELKNRYANVIPLPETRVPLQKINNDTLTEYINASYVRGPKNAMRYYIACQSPMESTVTDFWRMIWEQQCKVVIMLTDLVENGVEKCTEYIPPSEITDCHRLYGDFQVTLKKRETKEKYAISTLYLKNLENNTFREVYHIWYLWPVNGAQSDGAGLIAVLLEARALQRGGPGPIVVHCSPGTGRTGTLIALDLGIRQYEITRTVDVPRVVYTIRRDRAGAVQTKEQYAFIYKALNLYATKLAGGVLDST